MTTSSTCGSSFGERPALPEQIDWKIDPTRKMLTTSQLAALEKPGG